MIVKWSPYKFKKAPLILLLEILRFFQLSELIYLHVWMQSSTGTAAFSAEKRNFLKDQLNLVFHCIEEGIDKNMLQTLL